MPTADAVPIPDRVEPARSLSANTQLVLASRLSRPLSAAEVSALDTQLIEALSFLQGGDGAAQRRLLLETEMAAALLVPAAAQLWACVMEAAEGGASSVAAFALWPSRCCGRVHDRRGALRHRLWQRLVNSDGSR